MKTHSTIVALSLAAATAFTAAAAIVVPGANGTDGALNITADTVIDLFAEGMPAAGGLHCHLLSYSEAHDGWGWITLAC
jgi:hypothetical protein